MKKAVVITGAGSGIGAATAKIFSENSHFVFLWGRQKEKLQKVAASLNDCEIIEADLSDLSLIPLQVEKILQKKSLQVEFLVNNAGIFTPGSTLESELSDWEKHWRVNFLAPVELTRRLAPHFLSQKKGSIVNVASTLGSKPVPGVAAYSTSKAALLHWTQILALELAPHVRVNAVSPGLVETPIHGFDQLSSSEAESKRNSMALRQPLGRLGSPLDVAEAIYFLASEKSSWTTGSLFDVDGGINLL